MANLMSHELHALVHHVELSKAGWRDRALELIVLRAVDDSTVSCSPSHVAARVNDMLAAPLGRAQVQQVLDNLISQGKIVETHVGDIKLSEATREVLHNQLQSQEEREQAVQASFESMFEDLNDGMVLKWVEFRDDFLYPLVSELGARTYELLAGESIEVGQTDSHVRFLDRVPTELRAIVSDRITAFMDAGSHEVRGYVLRLLNAAFLVQATHLTDQTLDFVIGRVGKTLRLRVFVDTNFLFSLIGLHANPADDVVEALHHLIDGLKGRLDVKLYVLPITVDEAKRTISGYRERLSGLYLTKGMSEATKRGTQDLSGITLKFVEEGLKAGKRLSTDEYFGPYHDNLLQVARSKGVELFNESTDPLRMDQDVIDDVLAQMEFEKARRPEGRRKSYEKVLHDIVLWHFARRKRPPRLESPLDAEAWVATIDFGLLGYDRHKGRGKAGGPPVCIHPTVLLLLLQLWVPRNDLLESALVNSLQPLLPHEFDRQAEDVTIRILRSLSRIEGADNLGQDTVARILVDDAMRARIDTASSVEDEIAVVHTAIAEENRRLELLSKQLEREADGLKSEVRARADKTRELQKELEDRESGQRWLREQLEGEQHAKHQLEARVDAMELRSRLARAYLCVWGGAIIGAMVLTSAGWVVLTRLSVPEPVFWGGVGILGLGGFLVGATVAAHRVGAALSSKQWPKYLRRVTAAYWSFVVAGLGIELLGDWVSGLVGE